MFINHSESLLKEESFHGVIPSENGTPEAMPITEILSENEFFDYQAKYEGASYELTLLTSKKRHESISEEGVKAYELLGCRGW